MDDPELVERLRQGFFLGLLTKQGINATIDTDEQGIYIGDRPIVYLTEPITDQKLRYQLTIESIEVVPDVEKK